jgi:phosphomannomutase/phosphoglucomutase
MITGSHNPKDDNGLKIVLNDNAISGLELLEEVTKQDNILDVPEDFEIFDIVPTYLAEVTKKVKISNKLKVVLDAGNGAAGVVADLVFCALGIETISIHKEPDGNFPNHHPDPSKKKNLADLILNVKKHNADFGFAFDGDGDRVGMVTNTGESVLADHLIMMLTQHYLQKRNGPVIFDVKCSNQLARLIEELGGKPIMEKTGHFNIKKAIKEHHAVLGGEMSGHIFINHDWYGFDDAVFTAAVLSHIVASNQISASDIIKKFPKTFSTPELNLDVTDDVKFEMVDRFKNEMSFPCAEFNTIDGVRVTIGSAWGLMRASNTSPKLVFRFEAETQKELEEIQGLFLQNLNRIFPNLPINFS